MIEKDIRARFEAIKEMSVTNLAASRAREHETIRARAGRDNADAEIEARKAGEDDLAKVVEIGIELCCELFVDIHKIAAAAERRAQAPNTGGSAGGSHGGTAKPNKA